MTEPRLLLVDEKERLARLLPATVRHTYDILTARSGAAALDRLANQHVDVLISDQGLLEMPGSALLSAARALSPNTVRILLTGFAELAGCVGAVADGDVFQCLNKPWRRREVERSLVDAAERIEAGVAIERTLAGAVASLECPGLPRARHAAMEIFAAGGTVTPASSAGEAVDIARRYRGDVVVAWAPIAAADIVDLLAALVPAIPPIAFAMLEEVPRGDTKVKLVEGGRIYRFVVKPIAPIAFRLAISAAVHAHHRRIGSRSGPARVSNDALANGRLMDEIVASLSRFTTVW